jgi:hypothetical protein
MTTDGRIASRDLESRPTMDTDFARYWDSIRNRTMKVAELVPAEKMDWSPGEGAMSFGDLMRAGGTMDVHRGTA